MEAMEKLMQTAATAAAKAGNARDAKKSRKHKTGNWRMYWEDTLREYYPEAVVSYTTTDAANLKRAVNRGIPLDEVADMIEWSVKNWERLRLMSSYGNKPRGPAIPDMKFLIVVVNMAHAGFKADREAATLDLSKRRESLREPPAAPNVAKPAPLPLRPPTPRLAAPVRPLPRRPAPIDYSRTEADMKRLGLKQWGKGK